MTEKGNDVLPSPSDEELAQALKGGDDAAFDALVRRHEGQVYAVAYRLTGNREDALDVAQDVFLRVYRKIHLWRPTAGFRPWLLRLTRNRAIDLLRKRKRRAGAAFDETYMEAEPGDAAAPSAPETEDAVRAREIGARIHQGLERLSDNQRTVFVLRHYEGLALAEIAETLGCTVGSVKVHLFRAMKKLQAELDDLK